MQKCEKNSRCSRNVSKNLVKPRSFSDFGDFPFSLWRSFSLYEKDQ